MGYVAVSPTLFQVGDIVEIQISFVVWPVKGGSGIMRLASRSIALLIVQYSQISFS